MRESDHLASILGRLPNPDGVPSHLSDCLSLGTDYTRANDVLYSSVSTSPGLRRPPRATMLSYSQAMSVEATVDDLIVIACGNTIILRVDRLTILIDPTPQSGAFWMKADPDVILITHAHRDHFEGLAEINLSDGKRVIMSELTLRIILDGFDGDPSLCKQLLASTERASPGETLEFPGLGVNCWSGGHCPGNLSFELDFRNQRKRVVVAGEFSLRPIGGEVAALDARLKPDLLFVDGHHICDETSPESTFLANHEGVLQILESASSEKRLGVVLGASSLTAAQEVYAACAAFQRAGVANEYALHHGPLKAPLREYITASSHFPWDVAVDFVEAKLFPMSIAIHPVWHDHNGLVGGFAALLEESFDSRYVWAVPDYFDVSDYRGVERFRLSTHAARAEVDELVRRLRPKALCVYCSGRPSESFEACCRKVGTELTWAATELTCLRLEKSA